MSQEEIVVPKGWELSTIGQISKIKGGSKIPGNEDLGTKLHFIKVSDMNLKENFQYIIKPNLIITTSKKNIIENSIPPNSILIPKRGGAILTNKKRITSENSLLDPNIMAIIPTSKIEPLFLYYFFLKTDLKNFVGGEVVPQLNKYNIEPLEIFYPHDKKIQKQIVAKLDHILGELEVKKKQILLLVEQNKERIDLFEKNWYSFSISNLIENHPQRNEWDISLLEQVADVIDPHPSHRAPPKQNDGYPFAGIGDISIDGTINIQKARKIGETFVIQQEKAYEINEKSIGYGRVASVGKVMRLRKQKFRYAISPTLAVINPNSNINHDFLFYMLKSNYFFKQVSKQTTGSTRESLGIMKLRKLSVLVPMHTQQKDIVKKIKNLEDKFQSQKKQFENIKKNYESKINYINHIQSSVLDSAFSGKLVQ